MPAITKVDTKYLLDKKIKGSKRKGFDSFQWSPRYEDTVYGIPSRRYTNNYTFSIDKDRAALKNLKVHFAEWIVSIILYIQ